MVKIIKFKNLEPRKLLFKGSFLALFLFFSLLFSACKEDSQLEKEIATIPIHLKVDRFDLKLGQATADSLPKLINEYPYLFPKEYDKQFWVDKINDTIQQELNREVNKEFPDFEVEQQELESLFKHIKYYYPNALIPKVLTITSNVDYRNKVIFADSLLIIALDTYLGPDHHFYTGIQRYYAQNFRREQIPVDAASAFAEKIIPRPKDRRFIEEVIYQGKRLYLMEQLLSQDSKNEIISYTVDQYEWAKENEVNIWTYFVEKQLLFSTDSKLLQRFINPGPFSKFYLEFDSESPPRLGRYIGWQIVEDYMENTNTPLQMMIQKSADEIFKNAKFKPRK